MNILIKFPSRSRPEKFRSCIRNIKENLSGDNDVHLVATLDEDDISMNNSEIQNFMREQGVTPMYGISTSKIDACNRDMNKISYPWDIGILASDDMFFKTPFFDKQIVNDMQEHFPDLDGILHYPDGFKHDLIWSLPIFGRKWYLGLGYIYHPAYQSLFADEEILELAKARKKVAFCKAEFVNHNHPAWIGGKIDAQLKKTQDLYHIDKITFENRRRRNFYIS